jgi:broad specificity phosphatase PhoE
MLTELTKLYIVRHGQTEFNKQGIMCGHSDSSLTDQGIKQAQALGQKLNDLNFDVVFSSDLLRTQRTAEFIMANKQLAVLTSQALRERYYGFYEGRPREEYLAVVATLSEKLATLSTKLGGGYPVPEGVETEDEVMARVIPFLREIAVAYPGKNVLVVTHGAVLRMLLARIGFASSQQLPSGSVGNCAYVVLESDGIDFFVKHHEGIKLSINN